MLPGSGITTWKVLLKVAWSPADRLNLCRMPIVLFAAGPKIVGPGRP